MEASIGKKAAILWRILASLFFLAMIAVNALANALPINGMTTGEVADLYSSLFTPAGITFSIWSVIYLMLAGFLIYGWRYPDRTDITRLLPAFSLSCVLNMFWIVVWHNLYPAVSVVTMILLLLTLITLFRTIQQEFQRKKANILFIVVPFSIYLAWICVATIANVAAWITSLNLLSSAPQMWTIIMMSVAAGLAAWIFLKYQSPEFPAVVFWALLGIFLRWNGSEYQAVQVSSIILMMVLLAITVIVLIRRPRQVNA